MQHHRPLDAAAHAAHPHRPRITLSTARATSDALLDRDAITGLQVTELPPAEGMLQWHLAVALLSGDPQRPFAATVPAVL